jgi:hypothetical protein
MIKPLPITFDTPPTMEMVDDSKDIFGLPRSKANQI